MASFTTNPSANYSICIPMPNISARSGDESDEPNALEQLAQFTSPDGLIAVYWMRSTNQAVLEFQDKWYIQNDCYITDSIAEILGVKESSITVTNLLAGNKFDPSSLTYADSEMVRQIYKCTWSDYTCDHMLMQADLYYPYEDV
jgi:hypothetical protein